MIKKQGGMDTLKHKMTKALEDYHVDNCERCRIGDCGARPPRDLRKLEE